jgi:hypothetical protein
VLDAGACASAGPAAHNRPAITAVSSFMEFSCCSLQALYRFWPRLRI